MAMAKNILPGSIMLTNKNYASGGETMPMAKNYTPRGGGDNAFCVFP